MIMLQDNFYTIHLFSPAKSHYLIFCRSKDRQIAHVEIKSETTPPLGYVDTRIFQEPTGARDANTDLIEKVFLAHQNRIVH